MVDLHSVQDSESALRLDLNSSTFNETKTTNRDNQLIEIKENNSNIKEEELEKLYELSQTKFENLIKKRDQSKRRSSLIKEDLQRNSLIHSSREKSTPRILESDKKINSRNFTSSSKSRNDDKCLKSNKSITISTPSKTLQTKNLNYEKKPPTNKKKSKDENSRKLQIKIKDDEICQVNGNIKHTQKIAKTDKNIDQNSFRKSFNFKRNEVSEIKNKESFLNNKTIQYVSTVKTLLNPNQNQHHTVVVLNKDYLKRRSITKSKTEIINKNEIKGDRIRRNIFNENKNNIETIESNEKVNNLDTQNSINEKIELLKEIKSQSMLNFDDKFVEKSSIKSSTKELRFNEEFRNFGNLDEERKNISLQSNMYKTRSSVPSKKYSDKEITQIYEKRRLSKELMSPIIEHQKTFYEKNLEWKCKINEKIAKERKLKIIHEEEKMIFTPYISKKSLEICKNNTLFEIKDTYKRNIAWKENSKNKIKIIQNIKPSDQKEYEECFFKPKTNIILSPEEIDRLKKERDFIYHKNIKWLEKLEENKKSFIAIREELLQQGMVHNKKRRNSNPNRTFNKQLNTKIKKNDEFDNTYFFNETKNKFLESEIKSLGNLVESLKNTLVSSKEALNNSNKYLRFSKSSRNFSSSTYLNKSTLEKKKVDQEKSEEKYRILLEKIETTKKNEEFEIEKNIINLTYQEDENSRKFKTETNE